MPDERDDGPGGGGDSPPEDRTRVQFVLPRIEDSNATQAPTLEAGTLESGTLESSERLDKISSVLPDDDRYGSLDLIGKGGMGAVFSCRDRVVGRQVAMKVMRRGSAGRRARFLREARVQGRLEHPAVLPVYDLGEDADGVPYFTMRRLEGRTLAELIRAHRSGDVELVSQHPMRAMLAAFARVCSAVDYAHNHGVIHRDLKPENVMVGDFGQVYVIDWGVAKITGEVDEERDVELDSDDDPEASDDDVLTAAGVLGTPGYLSPEQARGAEVDARADIYALGCILFEILALEPLHLGPGASAKLASTLETLEGRPRRRSGGAHVAPELDEICARATALDLAARLGSARELHRAIDSFLAGHRDEERRKKLAEAFAAEAEQALTATADDTLISRRQALRSASQALAYDPDNEKAQATLVGLLIEPLAELPDEVAEQRRALEIERRRREGRVGVWLYLAWFGFLWVIPFLGADDSRYTLALIAVLLVNIGVTFVYSRTASTAMRLVAIFGNAAVLAVTTRFLGSFLMVPALGIISVVLLVLQNERRRDHVLAVVAIVAGLLGPLALEVAGYLEPIYRFAGGDMVVDSAALLLPRGPTLAVLSLLVATSVAVAAWAVSIVRRQSVELERQLLTRTWLLRQTLPDAIRGA
jgi:serine/threonine-protein kinase